MLNSGPTAQPLLEALKHQEHGKTLQLLSQLPIKDTWGTWFMLQRAIAPATVPDFTASLARDLLYRAHREELEQHWSDAEKLYRLIMQHNLGAKITIKARQGLQRIAKARQNPGASPPSPVRQEAVPLRPSAEPTTPKPVRDLPAAIGMAILILKSVPPEAKATLARAMAAIMGIDPYTARLQLPSRVWRLYRYGSVAEIAGLSEQLQAAHIPNFWLGLNQVQSIQVYAVMHLDSVADQVVATVRDPLIPGNTRSVSFRWQDVHRRVEGLLPLFEEVVYRDNRGQLKRRLETQDHAQIFDLQLPKLGYILRFYDAGYQFNQGIELSPATVQAQGLSQTALEQKTSWANWQSLKRLVEGYLPQVEVANEFSGFAETVVEQIEILAQLQSQIHLLRREESYWDHAFHFYSSLLFCQGKQ
jgi:hypothetical protein